MPTINIKEQAIFYLKKNKKGENGQTQSKYPVIIANDVTKGILPKIITFS